MLQFLTSFVQTTCCMKKYFLLMLSSLFAQILFAQENNFLKEFSQKWANAKTYTLQVAALMPEELYGYKPVPEERSFGEQLKHIAQNMSWLSSRYLKNENNPLTDELKQANTKTQIVQVLTKAFDYAGTSIRQFNPAQLDAKVDFFAGSLSKRQILILMNDHVTHHRGQILVYLRLKGLRPPDYIGW